MARKADENRGKNKQFEEKRGKGRPKGSINKSMRFVREILENKQFDLMDEVIEHYNSDDLKAKDKLKVLFKLMEYTYPKLREVDTDEDGNQIPAPAPVSVNIHDLMRIARGDE